MVYFKVEKLQAFCYECGCIGHIHKDCEHVIDDDIMLDPCKKFGKWLRASPFKPRQLVEED